MAESRNRYTLTMHPALERIIASKDRLPDLRAELEAAEREHHEAILAAVALRSPANPAEPLLSITEIAVAAGVSRTRVYMRIKQPVYGQRDATRLAS
jgi:type II secretory pathway component PulM